MYNVIAGLFQILCCFVCVCIESMDCFVYTRSEPVSIFRILEAKTTLCWEGVHSLRFRVYKPSVTETSSVVLQIPVGLFPWNPDLLLWPGLNSYLTTSVCVYVIMYKVLFALECCYA